MRYYYSRSVTLNFTLTLHYTVYTGTGQHRTAGWHS